MAKYRQGFTIVEVTIVVAIIAILAAVSLFAYNQVQINSRDSQRSSRVDIISGALEKYYEKNGEYPSCAAMTQSGSQVGTTLGIQDVDIFRTPKTPSGTTNAITCTDITGGSGPDVYAYVGDGSTACNTGNNCTSYTLKYRQESSGNIISVTARHQSAASPVGAPGPPVVSAAMSGTNAQGSAASVTCATGTPQYQFQYRSTATGTMGSWSAWTPWAATQTILVAASQGFQYGFQGQARCYDGTNTSATSLASNIATTVRPINTPSAPTYLTPSYFNSDVNAVVNYSSSCPASTNLLNGTFRTRAWTGGQWGPNPFGFLDSWQNYTGVDKNVEYWGKYQCTTPYSTSPYSAESYNVIVVHPS